MQAVMLGGDEQLAAGLAWWLMAQVGGNVAEGWEPVGLRDAQRCPPRQQAEWQRRLFPPPSKPRQLPAAPTPGSNHSSGHVGKLDS
jgi:hypothetical protein